MLVGKVKFLVVHESSDLRTLLWWSPLNRIFEIFLQLIVYWNYWSAFVVISSCSNTSYSSSKYVVASSDQNVTLTLSCFIFIGLVGHHKHFRFLRWLLGMNFHLSEWFYCVTFLFYRILLCVTYFTDGFVCKHIRLFYFHDLVFKLLDPLNVVWWHYFIVFCLVLTMNCLGLISLLSVLSLRNSSLRLSMLNFSSVRY